MSLQNKIEGVFRLTSPLHCASPDKSLVEANNETPTVQQRINTANGVKTIPYFPGNDLRGRLRRKAASIVLDHICATAKVSPQLYAGLNAGANSAQPDSADLSVEEAIRASSNVYMGLFGGGARMIRSRFSCQDLIPILAETIGVRMVPEKYGAKDDENFLPHWNNAAGFKSLEGWQLLQKTQVLRLDDTMRVLRPEEMARYIENAVEVVTAIQAQTLAGKQARKASKAAADAGEIRGTEVVKKLDIGNIAVFQSIIAGTPMYFRLDFNDDISDAQVGLLLLSLRDLVAEQRLGGWCRAGMGRYTVNLTLTRNGEEASVFDTPHAADGATLHSQVGLYVEEARREIQALTASGLSAFFENVKSKDEVAA